MTARGLRCKDSAILASCSEDHVDATPVNCSPCWAGLALTPFLYAADAKLMRGKVDAARAPESEQ